MACLKILDPVNSHSHFRLSRTILIISTLCFCFAGLAVSKICLAGLFLFDTDELKSVGDFRKDVNCFVKKSKLKSEPSKRFGAVADLCYLHHELVNDPRFDRNDQLRGFRAVVAARLKRCKREIEAELKKIARQNKAGKSDTRSQPVLDSQTVELKSQHESDLQMACYATGGPLLLWEHAGGNFAGPLCDFGPALVNLIENTIDPDSWRSRGGSGVIHYYQPLRILVVRTNGQVQNDLGRLLNLLRSDQ